MAQANLITPSRLSCLIALVLGVQLPTLHAAAITYTLDAKTGYQIGPAGSTASNETTATDPANVSAYDGYSGDNNNPNTAGAAAGNDAGWMYSRAGGKGSTYHHYSEIVQNATLTNDAASALDFLYNFTITWGGLTAANYGFTTAEEYSKAGYLVDIKVNGTSIWNSAFELLTDINGTTYSSAGNMLGSYSAGQQYYGWSPVTGQLNLGTLAAGASMQLSYSIRTMVSGNHLYTCFNNQEPQLTDAPSDMNTLAVVSNPDCGYGEYGEYGEYGYANFAGDTYAQFGDPNGFDSSIAGFTQQNIVGRQPGSVSEPAGLALVGAGLAGLAFRRRQRRSAQ